MKQLSTTMDLREDSVLRAYLKGYGYARLIVAGITRHFYVTDAPADFFERIRTKTVLQGYLWTQNSISFEFNMEVGGKITVPAAPSTTGGPDERAEPGNFIAFIHTADIVSANERKCLMAEVSLPFRFFTIAVAHSDKSFYTEEIQYMDGRIIILSDREAVFETAREIPITGLVRGHFVFDGDDIDFTARITSAESGTTNRYGIEFTGMNDRERNRILEYVFSIYRE
ncbi:MAG: PilZ domain-containing protein [Spirochaetales bacterium]|nr:MAG: PilZ domain-containing protein [Spirochaetales bacterium]